MLWGELWLSGTFITSIWGLIYFFILVLYFLPFLSLNLWSPYYSANLLWCSTSGRCASHCHSKQFDLIQKNFSFLLQFLFLLTATVTSPLLGCSSISIFSNRNVILTSHNAFFPFLSYYGVYSPLSHLPSSLLILSVSLCHKVIRLQPAHN